MDIAVAASYAPARVAHTVKKVWGGWYEWQARGPREQRLWRKVSVAIRLAIRIGSLPILFLR